MTLKDLILKYEFDTIVPELLTVDIQPITDKLYAFKEAFDTLRRMVPGKPNEDKIVLKCYEDWIDDVRLSEYLDASLSGMEPWDSCLATEIEYNPSGIDEIKALAAVFYKMTFWGFTPEHEITNRTRSKYEIKAEEILKPLILEYVKHTEHMSFRFERVILTLEGSKELEIKLSHRNRPKRMRDARINRVIKFLKTEDTLSRFFADSPDMHNISPNSHEFGHFFHAEEIKVFVFHSRTPSITGRAAYIAELLKKYFQCDVSSFTGAELMLSSSATSPITVTESSQIIQMVQSILPEDIECGLHIGIKESLGFDIELRMLLSR